MIGIVRESWILIGFVVLAAAAVLVAAAGVVHMVRERRIRVVERRPRG